MGKNFPTEQNTGKSQFSELFLLVGTLDQIHDFLWVRIWKKLFEIDVIQLGNPVFFLRSKYGFKIYTTIL